MATYSSLKCLFLKGKWKSLSCVQLFATPWTLHGILQARILEWVASPFLQGIFPTQGSNPGLPQCGRILSQLSHKEAFLIPTSQSDPTYLETLPHWVRVPFPVFLILHLLWCFYCAPTSSPFHKRRRLGNMFIKHAIRLTSVKEPQYHWIVPVHQKYKHQRVVMSVCGSRGLASCGSQTSEMLRRVRLLIFQSSEYQFSIFSLSSYDPYHYLFHLFLQMGSLVKT